MDCEANVVEKKSKKRQSKFSEALAREKPVFDPSKYIRIEKGEGVVGTKPKKNFFFFYIKNH
jgi:hypothetical protein